ncbi:helix-turn-helix domain-containing protein [Cohnella sp. CFH 77786]|uniref:helix-turn-helix domain-containing protein n=1 Tax=Cohnella sp. CFH 77786 TaxID=2662265 RepID=UPI001C60812C|nr:helix-turn-helix domain-containing protein [Cohnella sp. CFH 77786]MBW5447774.1 helix-turn-helix domain-containing protein [Cohnella sp. CFH 77786]
MNHNWYRRLLFSYMPTLLVSFSILIFLAVSMISELSAKETANANRVFAKYVTDSMETSLKGIERVVLEKIGYDDTLYRFFTMQAADDSGPIYYDASIVLSHILSDNPLIDSIYLYRTKDKLVLTPNKIYHLDDFPDKDYIVQSLNPAAPTRWSAVREYAGLGEETKDKVISISKHALLPFGTEGIVVVNVKVDNVLRIVDEMINPDITFMNVYAADGKRVYPFKEPAAGVPSSETAPDAGKTINRIHSAYLGWDFESGVKAGRMFGWMSAISSVWIAIGIVTVLGAVGTVLYVTRRNYKPIQSIMGQIYGLQSRGPMKGKDGDEFAYIGKVLENLMEQTSKYEKQYKEDLIVRRKQFFQELISDRKPPSPAAWESYANRFQLPNRYRHLLLAVAEIDRYADFRENYRAEDQSLLKFALTNVVHEFSVPGRLTFWAEWVTDKRLALLLFIDQPDNADTGDIAEILDKIRTWVAVNLKFSITIGVGSRVTGFTELSRSFDEAVFSLQYKMPLGNNRTIRYDEAAGRHQLGDTQKYYEQIETMCQEFRISDDSWPLRVEQFSRDLQQDLLRHDEADLLVRHLMRLFRHLAEGLPREIQAHWSEKTQPSLERALERAETLEELMPEVAGSLKQLHQQYASMRDSKNNRQLVKEIRNYIEDEFGNPDLSLNLISEKFDLSAKYASQLFKEQYGMKFVDFLVHLRMEQAKKLLLETDGSIQDISEQVGYTHPISFGRTFKKEVGVTPGDFRKYMRPGQAE